jgi:DNA-binding NtrC family response regulator
MEKNGLSAGSTTVQETAGDGRDVQTGGSLCTLQLLYSGPAGVILEAPRPLSAPTVAVGRVVSPWEICLPEDERVSRVHALIRGGERPGQLSITDNGSRNGVFVNGSRVTDRLLQDGDVLRIGNSFLLVRTRSAARLPGSPHGSTPTAAILGRSPPVMDLKQTIEKFGPADCSVLLIGESGTGKELTAEALHRLSPRARGPFVAVNCAEIQDSLAESLLFGHEKGSFTGAERAHEGYFRAAHRGTLFLDEVTELARSIQPKLLRALERHQVTPVGSTRPLDIDLRIIAATNRDLVADINRDEFRGDLFFRLADLTIHLPPLRERREDILPILLSAWDRDPPRLTPDLVEALLLHHWPYNVRELLKVARELKVKGQGLRELGVELIAERMAMQERLRARGPEPEPRPAPPAPSLSAPGPESQIPTRDELRELLRKHGGNISAMARERGKSRTQVHRWLEARGLDKDQT